MCGRIDSANKKKSFQDKVDEAARRGAGTLHLLFFTLTNFGAKLAARASRPITHLGTRERPRKSYSCNACKRIERKLENPTVSLEAENLAIS